MKKLILGLVAASAVAAAAPGLASADVSNNGTTNDAYGYCQANHIPNFNGDHNGIGHIRSDRDRRADRGAAGNRAPAEHCVDTQGVRPDQQQRLTYHTHLRPGSAEPGVCKPTAPHPPRVRGRCASP